MIELARAFVEAFRLLASLDPQLWEIIALSLFVSLSATSIALVVGVPVAALLTMTRFPGRDTTIVLSNGLLGLPPVIAGLTVYLLFSKVGPFGGADLLFTPAVMIIAQVILATPIVIALSHRLLVIYWSEYGDALKMTGASPPRAGLTLIAMTRSALVTVFFSAFGRCIAEVGAIMLVGGNIRGHTRTMTTAIVLETSKGEFSFALGLGLVLLALTVGLSASVFWFGRRTRIASA
jgi:tungstate transport system permease protein